VRLAAIPLRRFTWTEPDKEQHMPTLQLRLTAGDDAASALINLVGSLEGIESVEKSPI
jgi:hypothetical protein